MAMEISETLHIRPAKVIDKKFYIIQYSTILLIFSPSLDPIVCFTVPKHSEDNVYLHMVNDI